MVRKRRTDGADTAAPATKSTGKARTAPRVYETLREWMEHTGTNGDGLRALLQANGYEISRGHLSNILTGSRRCSLRAALELNEVTGVSVKSIVRWPQIREPRTYQANAQGCAL